MSEFHVPFCQYKEQEFHFNFNVNELCWKYLESLLSYKLKDFVIILTKNNEHLFLYKTHFTK